MSQQRTVISSFALVAAAGVLTPTPAQACGGFFCNNSQPVNQAAERVVFTYDGELIHMHIRITYAGPATEFGWILPVPAGGDDEAEAVKAELSSEELFRILDANYSPIFQLTTVFPDDCGDRGFGGGGESSADGAPEDGGEGGVQVLSREAVGPFDRAILSADSVETLRAWLDENGFDIPEALDAKMAPYVDEGRVFVVLKLLPGSDSGDIQPLRITFLSDTASIPIRPTAVAANPDMGLIVHALSDKRAIPTGDWRHVEINEAAIDWQGGGANYADVVSKAVDEAGGHAFTTDYAGSAEALQGQVAPLGDALLDDVRGAETTLNVLALFQGRQQDADVIRVLDSELNMPPDVNVATYLSCPGCFEGEIVNEPVDGADIAQRLAVEVDEPRTQLARFLTESYVTRMYSTMSPADMTADPTFDFNPDLPEVPRTRTAELHLNCDFNPTKIVTSAGLVVRLDSGANPAIIRREEGENVQGGDVRAASVVARMPLAGAPEIIEDNRPELEETYRVSQDDGGCGCRAVTPARSARGGGPVVGSLLRLWGSRR